jgi:CDP-glucose 4,6-dehydratase
VARRQRTLEVVDMNPDFWRGRRVLLTGQTGFKGAWLSFWLHHLGADVTGYALPSSSSPSLFDLLRLRTRIHSVEGDVRNLDGLKAVMEEARPQVVFHLAAQSLVRASYRDPLYTYSTNVMGTVNILEAVRQVGDVKVLVNITSDKCYQNREQFGSYRESDPMGGSDPYSSSKGCAELVTAAYRDSFFNEAPKGRQVVAVASARAGNVLGGGDWAEDRLIPDSIRALSRRVPVAIRNLNAIRPWQHVLEPLRGYLVLAEKLWSHGAAFTGGWNFGPSDTNAKPVSWVVERLVKLWGPGASLIPQTWEHPHEANYLKLDSSKANARLGWACRLDMDDTLEWVVHWYQSFSAGEDPVELTLSQIARYSALGQEIRQVS